MIKAELIKSDNVFSNKETRLYDCEYNEMLRKDFTIKKQKKCKLKYLQEFNHMINKKSKLKSAFFLCFVPLGLIAQNVIPSSGGNAGGLGGTASYTVGQIFTATNTGLSGSVIQGVQQPYEIFVITGINEVSINLICTVYPNPTKEQLLLKIENHQDTHFFAIMYDLNGKVMTEKNITEIETIFPTTKLNLGTYILKITDNKKEIKSFKIIKK